MSIFELKSNLKIEMKLVLTLKWKSKQNMN